MTSSIWREIKYLYDKYVKRKDFITDNNGDLVTTDDGEYITKD